MTAQEAAEWCAEQDGWNFEPPEPCVPGAWWKWNAHPTLKSRTWSKAHPHPLTLDGAAAALPEGWSVNLLFTYTDGKWGAKAFGPAGMWAIDGPDELTARYRLAVACRMAAKEQA